MQTAMRKRTRTAPVFLLPTCSSIWGQTAIVKRESNLRDAPNTIGDIMASLTAGDIATLTSNRNRTGVIGTQRATVWEVHPVTRIAIQVADGQWKDIESESK